MPKKPKPSKRAVPRSEPPPEPIKQPEPPQPPEPAEEPMEAVDEPTTEQETSQEGKAMPDKPPDTTEINDSEEGGNNKTTATFKEFDDEGKAIEIKDPSKITWSATPAHALTLKPDPKTGSCEITAVEGTEGDFQVVATDSESGKSGSGHVVVKSSKEHSHVEFGG